MAGSCACGVWPATQGTCVRSPCQSRARSCSGRARRRTLLSCSSSPRGRCRHASTATMQGGTRSRIRPGGPPPLVDAGNLEAYEIHVASHDGTQVPLSIIHKKGPARDGTTPTLLQGYGSHGIALTPTFSAPMLAWYE